MSKSDTAPAPYVFDIRLNDGTHDIGVDTQAQYGYFERASDGEGGGLWFDNKALTDYDGVWELPMSVIAALRGAGLTVDVDFE